jgi:hypothetical protein
MRSHAATYSESEVPVPTGITLIIMLTFMAASSVEFYADGVI